VNQQRVQNLEDLFDQGDFFVNVDWSKTRAYAMGLGELYVNLKGREAQGIVPPGPEAEALKKELRERLLQFTDPEDGAHPVRRVVAREEAFRLQASLQPQELLEQRTLASTLHRLYDELQFPSRLIYTQAST